MKFIFRLFLLIALTISGLSASAQQFLTPVKWEFSSKKISDTEAELIFKAKIDEHWHLYSQFLEPGGPEATAFTINKSKSYELIGKVKEGKSIEMMDPNFGMKVKYFAKEATFKQKIKLIDNKPFSVKGNVYFMVCDDKQCLPPEELDFKIKVDGAPIKEVAIDTAITSAKEIITQGEVKVNNNTDLSLWAIFAAGFLGGLAALLTPCVFPMIPMTVSFFTKQSKTRAKGIANAITYAISIIVIYVILGIGVSAIFGVDALNALSTNVWFNLFFFVLLIVFAISFFGAFEIVLPSSFVNKIDAKSDKGGLIGIFFMAFTLSLVSFSCTGPIIGTLLFQAAATGNYLGPTIGMIGFSMALALPFGLFAAFPGWLNSLPKSGGWLNSVKVVLGFLELALALKFASNADMVVDAHILERELFLVLWIVIFTLMGIYLLGWIKFSHDSDLPYVSVPRLFFAILAFSFSMYLIPGLWGAPLKLISGFPPPDYYSESPNGVGKNTMIVSNNTTTLGDGSGECPNNLPCYHDYDEALKAAKETGKPLLIDFTGKACVNCRKMEAKVWTVPEVDKRLRNDVILVSLYVDDKRELPKEEQREEKLGNKTFKIKTIGNKWSYLQAVRYQTNSQPQYVLLDHNEKLLNQPTGYDPDVQKYIDWLEFGKKEFAIRTSK
ncbi:MAG: cytochrome c biogenesis protein CcdA [Bacteroidota bacterium]